MDVISLLLGVAASLFAVLLGLFTLTGKIAHWIEGIIVRTLIETGLIRYKRSSDIGDTAWPNGSENLPDMLENMYNAQTNIKLELQQRRGESQ